MDKETKPEQEGAWNAWKKKVYAALALIILVGLVFSIGFHSGANKYADRYATGYDEGFGDCFNPVLDAAYSGEGDNIVSFRTDKWSNPEKKEMVAISCTLVEEFTHSDQNE